MPHAQLPQEPDRPEGALSRNKSPFGVSGHVQSRVALCGFSLESVPARAGIRHHRSRQHWPHRRPWLEQDVPVDGDTCTRVSISPAHPPPTPSPKTQAGKRAYLGHVVQAVEDVLPGLLRLDARLSLVVLRRLRRTESGVTRNVLSENQRRDRAGHCAGKTRLAPPPTRIKAGTPSIAGNSKRFQLRADRSCNGDNKHTGTRDSAALSGNPSHLVAAGDRQGGEGGVETTGVQSWGRAGGVSERGEPGLRHYGTAEGRPCGRFPFPRSALSGNKPRLFHSPSLTRQPGSPRKRTHSKNHPDPPELGAAGHSEGGGIRVFPLSLAPPTKSLLDSPHTYWQNRFLAAQTIFP